MCRFFAFFVLLVVDYALHWELLHGGNVPVLRIRNGHQQVRPLGQANDQLFADGARQPLKGIQGHGRIVWV